MKTPYDAAIRMQQREIEDMRVVINVQINQLVHNESSDAEARAAMEREAQVAAGDLNFSSYAYLSRMNALRVTLREDRTAMEERLAGLRSRAAMAYGSCRAMEVAANDYRAEEERVIVNAEQTMIDDRFAALHRSAF
jgi:hypothetical protein